ncbi:aminotransferase class I/II-fold pyridoxal phosphate-dependent enzyme [Duganella sp. FT135W]|uniref:Aminotransferase class I/II-fold pyridoxal phosphate-dependent enzyme n=1 Tax=Duganella flavida TaxID=2692175 RepID=A0A6L8K6Q7_9BURK|nr:PLP-dependent aminotransferase family protein [Duganella flavida]MYM22645.1 aminotransferase class I/II-fold pyridoxal phosphate-dependent enzyme [Duganella flavida]
MELHILIKGERDISGQIYTQIYEAIESGRLVQDQQIPPSRLLAKQLGVARKSVADAYNRLTYDKKIVGYVGRGTFVSGAAAAPTLPHIEAGKAVMGSLKKWGEHADMTPLETAYRCAVDFAGGEPSAHHFYQDEWRSCVLHGLRQCTAKRGKYGETAGVKQLREALIRHAAFSRGVIATPEQMVITNGAQQALDLIGRIVIEPGTCVAMEEPGYPGARLLFTSLGARVVGVRVDSEGIDVDAIPEQAKLIYVTPAHQFPLGMPMSEARRQALLEKANRIGAIIIEDDYDSEFRYSGQVTNSLQSMDKFGVVVFVGTMSKVMFPEMRIGYLIAPPAIAKAAVMVKRLTDWHSNTMVQYALAKFIADGNLLRHVRRVQTIYAQRREKIQAVFGTALAQWFELLPTNAGFHMVALAKRDINIGELIARARADNIGLYSLRDFYYEAAPPAGLFLGYGSVDANAIEPALIEVRNILRAMLWQQKT